MAPKKSKAKARAVAETAPPESISKMLGVLKYHSGKTDGKDAQRTENAQQALDVYKALSTGTDRARFVEEFEANGKGKNAEALKFAVTFEKILKNNKSVEVGMTEDMLTRHFFLSDVHPRCTNYDK